MRIAASVLFLVFSSLTSLEADAIDKADIQKIKALEKNKSFCGAAVLTTQCLSTTQKSQEMEECLFMGETVSSKCVEGYGNKSLVEAGQKKDFAKLRAINEEDFNRLKLRKAIKDMVLGERLYIYQHDYAAKYVKEYKEGTYREQMLLPVIKEATNSWNEIPKFVKEFKSTWPSSKDIGDVQCIWAQWNYIKWAYENMDWNNQNSHDLRKNLNSNDAISYREEAKKEFQNLITLKMKYYSPPCQSHLFERALKHLNNNDNSDPFPFFFSD